MSADLTIPEIKDLLAGRIFDLARQLAPGGRRSGRYYLTRSPVRTDKHTGSFWILIERNPGVWKDEATGEAGDVLALIQHCERLADVGSAIKWAKDWLGIARANPAELRRRIDQHAAERRHAEEQEVLALENQRKQAKAFWLDCWATVGATVGDTYLKSRGIDVAQLPRYPNALRFCPSMPHYETSEEGERLETRWPGLVVAMTCSTSEQLIAIHRTWLAPDGAGKAPIAVPRKIWPRFTGAAMRLSRGESNLAPKAAAEKGIADTLVLTEGLEDGLTVALACPELRVWAAGSLGNLANIKLPACAAEVVVCADNDWGKPQAQALLDKAVEQLAQQCSRISIARSRVGKDVNDCLRGEGALA